MASLDDLLTATKNVVTALNSEAQTTINLSGARNSLSLAGATTKLVSAVPGRVCVVSIIVAGSSTGTIYDASNTATATSARAIATIPNTVGVFTLNFPVAYGIVVTTGTGMTAAISYS